MPGQLYLSADIGNDKAQALSKADIERRYRY